MLQQPVYILNLMSTTGSDPLFPAAIDDGRIASFRRGHGLNQRFNNRELAFVDLHVFDLFTQAGDHGEHFLHIAHLADLLKLGQVIIKGEAALPQLLLHFRHLLLIQATFRFLDQGQDIAHT